MIRALAIAIGVLLLVPSLALGRPRIAILPLEGDSGTLQDVIVELLEEDYSIASTRQVTRALDELELDPTDLTNKQLKKLAKALDADALIRGDLGAKGSRRLLHLLFFVKGKKVLGFKVEFASARSKKFKEALRDKLYEKLGGEGPKKKKPDPDPEDEPVDEPVEEPVAKKGKGKGKAKGGEEPTDEAVDEPVEPVAKKGKGKGKGRGKGEEPDDGPVSKKRGGDEDTDNASAPADGSDDEDPIGEPGKRTAAAGGGDDDDEDGIDAEVGVSARATVETGHSANRAAVRVDFGPSFTGRNLSFTSRNFEEAPNPYSNGPMPGARLRAEIYPLAFMNRNSILAGLGFGGEYDQTFGLNLKTTVQPGTKFPVTQRAFSIGGRLRFVLGRKPTSASVTLNGGYMTRMFQVDRSALMDNNIIDLPDVGYAGFNGGLDLRVPVARSVAIVAGGRGIFVTTTGAIQRATEYGQAKVTGGEGHVGVDISIGQRMAIRAAGEITQLGFAFTGAGQQSNNRDGDPTTQDVGGAADRYLGASVLFGVLY